MIFSLAECFRERANNKPISVELFWLSTLFITLTQMQDLSARLRDILWKPEPLVFVYQPFLSKILLSTFFFTFESNTTSDCLKVTVQHFLFFPINFRTHFQNHLSTHDLRLND